jgi:hypothetical protein
MTWETRDRIAAAALAVSTLASIVAGTSFYYAREQYLLNAAREQRERKPTFHATLKETSDSAQPLEIEVSNRGDTKVVIDWIVVDGGTGDRGLIKRADGRRATDMRFEGGFKMSDDNPFPGGVAPRTTAVWKGYFIFATRRDLPKGILALEIGYWLVDTPNVKETYVIELENRNN